MTDPQLFDLGEPIKVEDTVPPFPECFIVAACYHGEYWKVFKEMWVSEGRAREHTLPAGWTHKRIYRIPGDQP